MKITVKKLIEMKDAGKEVILINDGSSQSIEDQETTFEKGMRAPVIGYSVACEGEEDEHYALFLDMTKFEAFNDSFMSRDWYLGLGYSKGTSKEAGYWKAKETLYLMPYDDVEILDNFCTMAYENYIKDNSPLSYIAWLELKYMEK